MYKIYSGLVQCPIDKTKLVPPPPRQRHTHCQQLNLITTRTQYWGGSFLPRTIRDWNILSTDRGNDCWHFCVTCLPLALTSQLFVYLKKKNFFTERERMNLRQCNNFNFKDFWPELTCGLCEHHLKCQNSHQHDCGHPRKEKEEEKITYTCYTAVHVRIRWIRKTPK